MKRILMVSTAVLAMAASGGELRLPEGASLWKTGPSDGRTWRQAGTMPLAYAAAKRSFDLALRKQGWDRLKIVPYDRVRWKSLEIWGRGEKRILVHYWREDVSLTGFAWGFLEETKR